MLEFRTVTTPQIQLGPTRGGSVQGGGMMFKWVLLRFKVHTSNKVQIKYPDVFCFNLEQFRSWTQRLSSLVNSLHLNSSCDHFITLLSYCRCFVCLDIYRPARWDPTWDDWPLSVCLLFFFGLFSSNISAYTQTQWPSCDPAAGCHPWLRVV